MTDLAKPDVDRDFRQIADRFKLSLEGHREFFDHVHGTLDELGEAQQREWSAAFRDALSSLTREEALELLRFAAPIFRGGFERVLEEPDLPEEKAVAVRAMLDLPDEDRPRELRGTAAEAFTKMLEPMRHLPWRGHGAQRERLYQSVLTGVVAQFEVLIAAVAHQFYKNAPASVGRSEKVLSLQDLQDLGSVEAAIDLIIERRVDDLLADSVDGWAEFFEKRLSIDLKSLSPDWTRLVESIQRRHLIVHTGGIVSRRYLQHVAPALVEEFFGADCQPGAVASLNPEYVKAAIERFEVTGMLLLLTVWVKVGRNTEEVAENYITDYLYDNLVFGRWRIAEAIAARGVDSALLSESGRLVCRLNRWLCLKRTQRFEGCRPEVEKLDVSALHARFALVRLALLDDEDEFFRVLEVSDGAGLDRRAWDEWPVFAELREKPRFQELRRKYLKVEYSEDEDFARAVPDAPREPDEQSSSEASSSTPLAAEPQHMDRDA